VTSGSNYVVVARNDHALAGLLPSASRKDGAAERDLAVDRAAARPTESFRLRSVPSAISGGRGAPICTWTTRTFPSLLRPRAVEAEDL
jgi:hypothetical protein